MSNSVTRAGGRSAAERTVTPVSIVPPSLVTSDASARAIDCDPPAATGQPPTWPAPISMRPAAELSGRSSGAMAWAATPANAARASSVRNSRAVRAAGASARTPKAASASGWDGTCSTGAEGLVERVARPGHHRPERPAPGRPVVAQRLHRGVERAEHDAGAPPVERVGHVDLGEPPGRARGRPAAGRSGTATPRRAGGRPSRRRGARRARSARRCACRPRPRRGPRAR